jgi:hypothetical protein
MSEKKGLTPSYIGVRVHPLLYLVIYHSQCSSCFPSLLGEIPKVHTRSMVVMGHLLQKCPHSWGFTYTYKWMWLLFPAEIMTAYEFYINSGALWCSLGGWHSIVIYGHKMALAFWLELITFTQACIPMLRSQCTWDNCWHLSTVEWFKRWRHLPS